MIVLKKNSNNFSVKIGKSYIPIEESLIPYMCDEIQLEKGVTFGDFFNIILKHHEYYSEVFSSHLSGVKLSDFFQEWAKSPKKEIPDKYGNMEKLIIGWENIEILDEKDLLNEENGLEINWLPSFCGTGKSLKGDKTEYAIEFTPLNELKEYPLELIPNTTVYNLIIDKKLLSIERGFTVYEVLSAIFYEITYVGSPEQRNEKLEDLKDVLEDVKKDFDGEGNFIGKDKSKYTGIDEVMKGLKEKINDYMEESGSNEEFDEYGHKKGNKTLDDILKNLKIDKPNEENE